jgi:hypothetical protein
VRRFDPLLRNESHRTPERLCFRSNKQPNSRQQDTMMMVMMILKVTATLQKLDFTTEGNREEIIN